MEYRDVDAEARMQAEQMVTHVLAGDGKLWALDQYSGRFGQVNNDGVGYTHLLSLAGLNPEPDDEEDCVFPGGSENHLCLFSVEKERAFFAGDSLAAGERQEIALSLRSGVAYRDGGGYVLYTVNAETERSSGGYAQGSVKTSNCLYQVRIPYQFVQ